MDHTLLSYAAKKGIKLVYIALILGLTAYLVNMSMYNYFQYRAALIALEKKGLK